MTARPAFTDHFGARSQLYREVRPTYPAALFHFLAIIAPSTRIAWDCATGNGQAATSLAGRFTAVLGTDPSEAMIAEAAPHPRVRYAVTTYDTKLEDRSVGVVTVAQALHWLDVDAFIVEARRVLVPDGLLAAWCYTNCRVSPGLDELLDHFHDVIVGPYWPLERKHVVDGYRAIALPIDEYAVPPFEMLEEWNLAQYLGYIRSWSGVAKCVAARGEQPVLDFEEEVRREWGNPLLRRPIRWPMRFRVGEVR